jgi:tetratricopeptide (TPR) repeat protein
MSQPIHAMDAGLARHLAGNLPEAEVLYLEVIKNHPCHAPAWHLLGVLHHQRGQSQQAVNLIQRAISLNSNTPEYYNNLGISWRALGRLDQAISSYRCALIRNPHYADAHFNLGNALQESGQLNAAVDCYHRALVVQPDAAEIHYNLATVLLVQDRLKNALESYQAAVALKPDYAEAHNNMGAVLRDLGRINEAVRCFRKSLEIRPDYPEAHVNLALALLLIGDFKSGWAEHEWRWQWPGYTSPKRNFTQPLWQGEPLKGQTILVYAEQGLGDSIQFGRYLPQVIRCGGQVIFECPASLKTLFETALGTSQIIAQGNPLPHFDVQAPLLSLPLVFGTTLETIPNRVPYLAAPKGGPPFPAAKDSKTKVGLVWAGNPRHSNDRHRSVDLDLLVPLLQLPEVACFSLQVGASSAALAELPAAIRPDDLGAGLRDFGDTAALITQVDLIISVDTALAHLAGALGKPVWLLLPFVSDWRWMLGREDSPWYPAMRLFRQPHPGDWPSVIEKVRQQLIHLRAPETPANSTRAAAAPGVVQPDWD